MKRIKIILGILAVILLCSTTSVREAQLTSKLDVTENLVSPTTSSYWHLNGLDEVVNYRDGGTRNDVDHVYADTVLGDGSLDLTSLANTLGESMDLSGEVIVAIKFSLEDDSAATCDISEGVSNGYPLLGASFAFRLEANQSLLFMADTVLTVVASGDKTIDYDSSNDSTALSIILITADGYN